MALIIGLLLGLSIPAIAISRIDAKQKRQIQGLRKRATLQSVSIAQIAERVSALEVRVEALEDARPLQRDWQMMSTNSSIGRTGTTTTSTLSTATPRK